MDEENSIIVTRSMAGRTITAMASYNEKTDYWNVVIFEGARLLEARATDNAWVTIFDMIADALVKKG